VPANVELLCILPLAIFPLTLAYVIVVHRALDVRAVIRQGLQYALAQRGIRVMQLLLTLLVLGVAVSAGSQGLERVQKVAIVIGGAAAIAFMDKGARNVSQWTDRRFFREAHQAKLLLNELSESVRHRGRERGRLIETVGRKISESLHVARVAILLKAGTGYQLWYLAAPGTLADDGGIANRLRRSTQRTILRANVNLDHAGMSGGIGGGWPRSRPRSRPRSLCPLTS
jgi:sigma-B regulation protein RsbU (phosphoserine phosphatase)